MLARAQQIEFDTGPKAGAGTERLCAVTRIVKPVAEMLRFVAAPDGAVVPDLKRKLPGRGVWITATREALVEAARRGILLRGFGRKVDPSDLADMTERLLERAALDALAIAGKAGQAVSGFSKVEAALADGNVVAVLHANDAAADGVRKLTAAVRRFSEAEGREPLVISAFSAAQLNLALGRPNVIHAALLAGPAAETFIARHARLERFRTGYPAPHPAVKQQKPTPEE
ncbi:MAG TPA: RNA-binding protein [Xanthobacteraceae bacterium]|nr:RNA-binding protein [Xanthobacteraceae bacterium]